MAASNDKQRVPLGVSAFTSGVTASVSGGVVPVNHVHTKNLTVIKHRVNLPGARFALTAAVSGGAADAQGQKLLTLPQGKWLVLASRYDLSSVTNTGYSATSAVFGIGTAAATADDAALTSTEADVLASQTLGDGSLASAAAETDQAYVLGTGTAPALIGSTTADTDLYLNVGGSWIHASATAATLTMTGTIELFLLDLGDI